MDVNEKSLSEFSKETEEIKKKIEDANKIIEEYKKRQKELQFELKTNSVEYKTLGKSIEDNKKSIAENSAKVEANKKILDLSKGSLQQNKALLAELTKQYEELSAKEGDNSKSVENLNIKIGHLNSAITDQEKAVEKSREVFDFQAKSIDAVKGSIEQAKGSAGDFAPELDTVTKSFNVMKDGLSVVKTGFQSVGGAIKATGFGMLMLVLQSLISYFTETTEGTAQLQGLLSGFKKIIEPINILFQNFGKVIMDTFKNPKESLTKLGALIWENLGNRLKAIGVILDGIIHFDFKKINNGVLQGFTGVTNLSDKVGKAFVKLKKDVSEAYDHGKKQAGKAKEEDDKITQTIVNNHHTYTKQIKETLNINKEANDELIASKARMAQKTLQGYADEINNTEKHFKELKDKYKNHKATTEQLEKERVAAITAINKKFRDEDSKKLDEYHKELNKIGLTARQQAQSLLDDEYTKSKGELESIKQINDEKILEAGTQLMQLEMQPLTETSKLQIESLKKQQAEAQKIFNDANGLLDQLNNKHSEDKKKLNNDFDSQEQQKTQTESETKLQKDITGAREGGHESTALKKELDLLKLQHDAAVKAAKDKGEATTSIEAKYAKQKAELEDKLISSKIHAGDKFIDAVLKNTKKDSAIYKAAFIAKKATSIADTIISTKRSVMESLKAYSGIPFIGQALGIAQAAFMATQGAMSIADIAKQKPGMAQGGQFISDGRGAVLPGYSRTDNTNAYLRSGEAVVVSEAMRNPWARNLVSAINVAYGGRDFSIPNTGSGYAIGGVFTDGGNASRYYSQPMNDQKDLANTLAYQMLNNFPPIYVDVKDVNNQQNILAQTVNRVNL